MFSANFQLSGVVNNWPRIGISLVQLAIYVNFMTRGIAYYDNMRPDADSDSSIAGWIKRGGVNIYFVAGITELKEVTIGTGDFTNYWVVRTGSARRIDPGR